jgi:hypothetical protein
MLHTTTIVSGIPIKASRWGIDSVAHAISLAVQRGCRHYRPCAKFDVVDPGKHRISNAELATYLLLGENEYNPMAIRCGAQLLRSPENTPQELATLAKRNLTDRVLSYITACGIKHDKNGKAFWEELKELLPPPREDEPNLPDWTRFVSMPGVTLKDKKLVKLEHTWLIPQTTHSQS